MSVLGLLVEEHVMMRRMVGDMSWRIPTGDEDCVYLRRGLIAFFCALKRHEEFEEAVFSRPAAGLAGDADLRADLTSEHRRLEAIIAEIVAVLRDTRAGACAAPELDVRLLDKHLRAHFEWEENALWPRLGASSDPAEDARLEAAYVVRLRALAGSIAACGVWLSDSSGRAGRPDPRPRPPSGR